MKKILVFVLSACLLLGALVGCMPKEDEFVAPKDYASIVKVTINPTVNLYLDADEVVLAVEYVNADAKESYKKIESQLVGASLDKSVDLVVKTAAEDGYLKNNKEVKVDVVEAKEEKQTQILTVALAAAEKTLVENEIEAEVVVLSEGKEVAKEELATPVDRSTPAPESTPTPEVTQDPTSVATPTAEPTKKPAGLTKNAPYCVYKFNEINMLERYKVTFADDGYAFSVKPFDVEDYSNGQGEVIVYEGKTYYEAGGRGGGGEYTVNGSTITLLDDNITLTIVSEDTLKVESVGADESFLKVGDLLKK